MKPAYSSFERMMDEIAAAESVAELDYLHVEVCGAFALNSPERRELETTLDAMRQILVHGRARRAKSSGQRSPSDVTHRSPTSLGRSAGQSMSG